MKRNLRILLVEDDLADAELIAHELKASGFEFSLGQVRTETEFRHELEVGNPDVILSDHGLPSFSGFAALALAREACPDLPFIFVSGSNDPGMVAKMYEDGATDYVFKPDLQDLKSALLRALEEPKLDAPPSPAEFSSSPAPSGMELQIPTAQPDSQSPGKPACHLSFCPQCHQAWDEAERIVNLEARLSESPEIVVLRQICSECGRSYLSD